MARSNAAPANTPACPPLPSGSFDLNELHDAAKKGEDLGEIIAATSAPDPDASASEPSASTEPEVPAAD